jgi:hypothetical protein
VRQLPAGKKVSTEAENIGKYTSKLEDLVLAVVNLRLREFAIALHLLAVTICTYSVYAITNPSPVYSQS